MKCYVVVMVFVGFSCGDAMCWLIFLQCCGVQITPMSPSICIHDRPECDFVVIKDNVTHISYFYLFIFFFNINIPVDSACLD